MRTLYFDCSMGAAGDMLVAALLELHPEPERVLQTLNEAFGEQVQIYSYPDEKCGIRGTHITVNTLGHIEDETMHDEPHHHGHHHTSIRQVQEWIESLSLPEDVIEDALHVYRMIAEAESAVHGHPVENIHFHEVGSLDAMADVVGVCFLMRELSPDRVLASPVHVGSGTVRCAHGVLSVPTPATQVLLQDIPIYTDDVAGELCTPTGAALLRYYVKEFGSMPVMRVSKAGIGTGTKDFSRANLFRVLLCDETAREEEVLELVCNLDDMSPEDLGFVQERLFSLGALDVYTTSIGMKKCRPGVMLTCMCWENSRDEMLSCIFQNTSTLGVRQYTCKRYGLSHSVHTIQTSYGPIRIKRAEGWDTRREKCEYEDLRRIALEQSLSLSQVRDCIKRQDFS